MLLLATCSGNKWKWIRNQTDREYDNPEWMQRRWVAKCARRRTTLRMLARWRGNWFRTECDRRSHPNTNKPKLYGKRMKCMYLYIHSHFSNYMFLTIINLARADQLLRHSQQLNAYKFGEYTAMMRTYSFTGLNYSRWNLRLSVCKVYFGIHNFIFIRKTPKVERTHGRDNGDHITFIP